MQQIAAHEPSAAGGCWLPAPAPGSFSATALAADLIRVVDAEDYAIVPLGGLCDGYDSFRDHLTAIAEALGSCMVQNEAGDTLIDIFDHDVGRIEQGARYHQTRQGGDIHTDSVNRPEPMKYLCLGCASPALIGGQSIVIHATDVLQRMRAQPDVIETLSQPFLFETRGMTAEPVLFEMPVLTETPQGPSFRYLRSYIESAHRRGGRPLTPAQVYALDVLDAYLDISDLQSRLFLRQGDFLVTADTCVFHGRTSFVDGPRPGAWRPGRHMLRFWVE